MTRLKTVGGRLKAVEDRAIPKAEPDRPRVEDGGRSSRPWSRIRQRVLERDLYTCQACGLVSSELDVDHIVRSVDGGSDDLSNLQALCWQCHHDKTMKENSETAAKRKLFARTGGESHK